MEQKDEFNPPIECHIQADHKRLQEATVLLEILAMGREEIEAGEYQLASEFFEELRREKGSKP